MTAPDAHGWRKIAEDPPPRDGTPVDLWIVGPDDMVDFYAPHARKVKGKPLRAGRAPDFVWRHKPPNRPAWYPAGGLGMPLSPDVTPTHWQPLPAPPEGA